MPILKAIGDDQNYNSGHEKIARASSLYHHRAAVVKFERMNRKREEKPINRGIVALPNENFLKSRLSSYQRAFAKTLTS